MVSDWLSLATGFDGPLSLGPPSTPSSHGSAAVSSSSSSDIRCLVNPKRLCPCRNGTINWDISLPRRRPRRQHNNTEVSRPSRTHCNAPLGSPAASQHDYSDGGNGLIHDPQKPSLAPEYANDTHLATTKSCPELNDQPDELVGSVFAKLTVSGTHLHIVSFLP